MKTTVAAPPPPPAPVDPGQSTIEYMRDMADPALQQMLYSSEAQFRPQYTELNLQDMNQYLQGVGGQKGILGQYADINAFNIAQQTAANTAQREADISNVERLGGRASAAFANANPALKDALAKAQALQAGGYSTKTAPVQDFESYVRSQPDLLRNWQDNVSKNTQLSMAEYGQQHFTQAGQAEGRQVPMTGGSSSGAPGPASPYQAFENAVSGAQPNFGNINFNPAQAAMLGAAPQASAQGYSAQGYNPAMLGAAPLASSQGYSAAMAAPVANVSSQNIAAGQVGGGMLGASLYGQALGASGLGAAGQALDARAQELAGSTGAMTGDEIRAMEQQLRSSYGARGTLDSSGSVSAEALGRLTNERANRERNLALASQLNAANQAELGANRGFAQSVQGAELGRQFQNVGNDLAAQQQNQQAALQAALANQGVSAQQAALNQASQNQAGQFGAASANQAALANQAMLGQYGLSNQASQNQAAQFGAGAANQAAQFGAGAGNVASLANQQMLGQYGLSNQSAANQFGLYNNQQGLATQEANRAFNYGQYGDQLRNLGILGQFGQSQLGADRGYALQLAQMQLGTASDPFQAILGRSSGALQYGQGMQNMAGQYTQGLQGPQLFDPNAGINLALQNNANQAGYQSNIYGSQTALAGANAGAKGAMIGAAAGLAAAPLGGMAIGALTVF